MLILCQNKGEFRSLPTAYFLHNKKMIEARQKLVKNVICHDHCDTYPYVITMSKAIF